MASQDSIFSFKVLGYEFGLFKIQEVATSRVGPPVEGEIGCYRLKSS